MFRRNWKEKLFQAHDVRATAVVVAWRRRQ
jgi:hypothetical protein